MASATADAGAVDAAGAKRGWGVPGAGGMPLPLPPASPAPAPIKAMMRGNRRQRAQGSSTTSPDPPLTQLPPVVHPGRYDAIRSATDGDCPVDLALRSSSGLSRGSGLGAPSSPTSSSSADSLNESSGDVVRGRVSFSGDGWAEGAWATCSSGRLKMGAPAAAASAATASVLPDAPAPGTDGPPSVSAWTDTPTDLTESRRRIVEVADRLNAPPEETLTVANPPGDVGEGIGACGDVCVHTVTCEPVAVLPPPAEDSGRATDTDADATDEEEMAAEMAKWEAETAADGEEDPSVKDEEDDNTEGAAEGGLYRRPCSGSSAKYGSEDGAYHGGGVFSRLLRRVRGDGGDALLRTRKEPHPSRKRRIVRVRRQRDDALVRLSAGFRCRTGWEPLAGLDKTNQDAVMLLLPFGPDDRSSLFGVLDGHGRHGHHVSFFVARQLELRIAAGLSAGLPIDAVFRSACAGADARLMATAPFDTDMSGSTAVFALVRDDDLYVGNVGDSRAVLGRVVPPRPRRLPGAARPVGEAVAASVPASFPPSTTLPIQLKPATYFGNALGGQNALARRHTPTSSPSADGCSATLSEVSSTLSMTPCSSVTRTASAGGTPLCSGSGAEATRRQRWRPPHAPRDASCKVEADRLLPTEHAVRTTSTRTEDGTGASGAGALPRKHTLSALSPRALLRNRDASPAPPPPAASASAVVPSNLALAPAADLVASLMPPSPPRYEAVGLSWDHKPSRPDERKRILAAGGRVERWNATALHDLPSESEASAANSIQSGEAATDADVTTVSTIDAPPPPADDEEEEDSAIAGPERVWLSDRRLPGLALSRAFGDGVAKSVGVTAVPDVTHLRLTPADAFVILASDGVWDWVPSSEAVRFVGARRQRKEPPQAVAEALVRLAARRWAVRDAVTDDITAVVVYFDYAAGETGGAGGLGRRAEVGAGRWSAVAAAAVTPNEVERMLPPLPQPVFEPPRPPLAPEVLDSPTASPAAPASGQEGFMWTT